MNMLQRIKMEYGLDQLKWEVENATFYSDRGKKKLQIWKDKSLLDWHVQWRDLLGKNSNILVDRMLRTKDGSPFFVSDAGFITVHDSIDEAFPSKGEEKQWGNLIGTALLIGKEHSLPFLRKNEQKGIDLKGIRGSIEKLPLIDSTTKYVLERSFFEGKTRSRKARDLMVKIGKYEQPILLPFQSISHAKQIFFSMYYECGKDYPVKGLVPLRNHLFEWYEKNGESSTIKLLDEINNYFLLKNENGLMVLANILYPYELEETIYKLSRSKSTVQTSEAMTKYYKNWNIAQKLVILLSSWIESR